MFLGLLMSEEKIGVIKNNLYTHEMTTNCQVADIINSQEMIKTNNLSKAEALHESFSRRSLSRRN